MITIESVSCLSDEELVLSAQNGDNYAEESLIKRYKNYVSYYSSKYYMSGMEKDDIIQEGMIGLCNAIKDYQSDKISFKNFAIMCISRRIISLLKSANRQKHLPLNTSFSLDSIYSDEQYIEAPADHNPESIFISNETLGLYEQKINDTLSTLEMKVFRQYLNGISYAEISTNLNINKKSVDNAVQRIKKKLLAVLI